MSVRPILLWPARILTEPAGEVDLTSEAEVAAVATVARDLWDTMKAAEGVGLAAVQIGVPVSLFVLALGVRRTCVNPSYTVPKGAEDVTVQEGCLSLPGFAPAITRPAWVDARWWDMEAREWCERRLEGTEAVGFQHETDHCRGKMFTLRLSPAKRKALASAWRKAQADRGNPTTWHPADAEGPSPEQLAVLSARDRQRRADRVPSRIRLLDDGQQIVPGTVPILDASGNPITGGVLHHD